MCSRLAVQKNRRHKPPGLREIVGQRHRSAHARQNLAVDSAQAEQRPQSARRRLETALVHGRKQADAVEHAAESSDTVGHRRSLRHQAAERAAGRGERKRHVRAALMAAAGRRAHQRAAGRAEPRARLLGFGVKHRRESAAPAVQLVAPSNGKWHVVSLPVFASPAVLSACL